MKHAHYENARDRQVRETTIETLKQLVRLDVRRRVMSFAEAVTELREAGCFEAEIQEALS